MQLTLVRSRLRKLPDFLRYARLARRHPSLRKARFAIGREAEVTVVPGASCTIGKGVLIRRRFTAWSGSSLTIGENTFVNSDCVFVARAGISIGAECRIGERVSLHDDEYEVEISPGQHRRAGWRSKPIVIGDDVWIGANVVVVAGVTIGDGSVVGANSVVTSDIPPYSKAAGVPARVLGTWRGSGTD